MSKASSSQVQQLPVARPDQPSQLAAVRWPACIRWPLRNQTAGIASGAIGIAPPSCARQPSGSGSGSGTRCEGDRLRTMCDLCRERPLAVKRAQRGARDIQAPDVHGRRPARRARPHATPSASLRRIMQGSVVELQLAVGSGRGKRLIFLTCHKEGSKNGGILRFRRLHLRRYLT